MPRYFFSIQDGHDLPDHEGTVLAGPDAARALAVRTSGEILQSLEAAFWSGPEWRMEVTDEQGGAVCTLSVQGTK